MCVCVCVCVERERKREKMYVQYTHVYELYIYNRCIYREKEYMHKSVYQYISWPTNVEGSLFNSYNTER